MARLRREPEPARPPAELERFHLADWFDPDEPVPEAHAAEAGLWRHVRAFRRYLEAKHAWRQSSSGQRRSAAPAALSPGHDQARLNPRPGDEPSGEAGIC